MKSYLVKRWLLRLTALALTLAVLPCLGRQPRAQGPECPPGFFWRRMSGVGCMQEGCLDIPDAKYNAVGACICVEGYKACYEPIDYASFDSDRCQAFCPVSTLMACVPPDAACPGEGAPPSSGGGGAEPAEPAGDDGQPGSSEEPEAEPVEGTDGGENADAVSDGEDGFERFLDELLGERTSVDDLLRDLEAFLAGRGVKAPTAGQAAAAGTVSVALLSAWILNQLLSGARLQDVLDAVSRWLQARRLRLGKATPPTTTLSKARSSTMPSSTPPSSTSPAPAKPPWHARVPKEDHIYDADAKRGPWHQTSIDFLKDLGIYSRLKALDPRDPDYHQKLDQLMQVQTKDGRQIKAITFEREGDSAHGPIDEGTLTIVVREPAYKQPAAPSPPARRQSVAPQPKKSKPSSKPAKPAPTTKPVTGKKVPPPSSAPSAPPVEHTVDLWGERFKECQDLAHLQASGQPPSTPQQAKVSVHQTMKDHGYEPVPELTSGKAEDPGTRAAKWGQLRDGDIIAFNKWGHPGWEKPADHYAVVRDGRIHEIRALGADSDYDAYRYHTVSLNDLKYFENEQVLLDAHGNPVISKSSGKPVERSGYYGFMIYRKHPK